MASSHSSRIPPIDRLRGLSILAVVLHHINIRIRFNKSALGAGLPDWANRALFWSGSYGVKVFFVISGFLITRTILDRWGALPSIDVPKFYRLRAARILPCLLGLLAILVPLDLAGVSGFTINPARATLLQAMFAVLTFHSNVLETRVGYLPACWDVLWSLSVEEVFYLGYPIVCRLIRWRWLLGGLALALVITGPFARTVLAANDIGSDYAYLAGMDGIAIGCVAAVVVRHWKAPGSGHLWLWIFGWALVLLVVVFRQASTRLGLGAAGLDVTILELGTALLLISGTQKTSGVFCGPKRRRVSFILEKTSGIFSKIKDTRRLFGPLKTPDVFLRRLGQDSYEVYLTHSFFTVGGEQLYRAMGSPIDSAIWWFVGITSLSVVTGRVVAKYFSEPMNRRLRGERRR